MKAPKQVNPEKDEIGKKIETLTNQSYEHHLRSGNAVAIAEDNKLVVKTSGGKTKVIKAIPEGFVPEKKSFRVKD